MILRYQVIQATHQSGTGLTTYKKLNSSWAAQRGSSTSSWNKMNMQQHGYVHQVNGQHIVGYIKSNYAIGGTKCRDACGII